MRTRTFLLALAMLACLAGTAEARRARGTTGIGIVLGDPTGLTVEARMSRRNSLAFALGVDRFDENIYFQIDYLIRLFDLVRGPQVNVPLYIGFGAFFFDHDRGDNFHIGPRVPFGVSFEFQRSPIQIFAELAVRFVLIDDHDHDHEGRVGGAIGFRVIF